MVLTIKAWKMTVQSNYSNKWLSADIQNSLFSLSEKRKTSWPLVVWKKKPFMSVFYFFLKPKFYIQSRLYSYVSSFLASNYFIFQKCCNKNTYTIYRSYLLPAYYEFFDQFRMQAKRSLVLTDSRLCLQLRNSKR